MPHLFAEHPGLWFVAATLLPLLSVVLLLLAGFLRNALRGSKDGLGATLFELLGGEVTGRGPAYVATAAIGLAFVCSSIGFITFLADLKSHDEHKAEPQHHHAAKKAHEEFIAAEAEPPNTELAPHAQEKHAEQKGKDAKHKHDHAHDDHKNPESEHHASKWAGSITWASVDPRSNKADPERASTLKIGYYIDSLSAVMFVMVTFIATLIHLFSIGYMADELQKTVEDHEVHAEHGHFHRRGRFGRFFLFLSLFCFSMLNLILADNFFQVFVSWELVGVCSYLLVGFYYERTSASNAANKAFITNRVGDFGFIIGLVIVWTYVGSLDFQEVFTRIRCPERSEGKVVQQGWQVVRADLKGDIAKNGDANLIVQKSGSHEGVYALIFPRHVDHADFDGPGSTIAAKKNPGVDDFSYIPYWMLVVAGLGIFLGCVGKSAQFPLQVWLPDAMEGPTPVSALIHAATMVAAGVYLVGRCYPLFVHEVTLTIAYTGAITLFVAATIALVMTDIKKVLAYSTVSQLGYMMLALGVGGWAAGLFHLVTHAFFKALLFLGSGSVIYGCHHVQDMHRMGGLFPKMKITAITMLMGVLAISGIPLFSGWYSKDAVLANALGFSLVYKKHMLLFILPLFTAGLTTFYMFRMWFLTFCGKPKDEHVFEHAHESPWVMTVPLILLAIFSVTAGWGAPIWDAEASWLEHLIHHAQPDAVKGEFGGVAYTADGHHEVDGLTTGPAYADMAVNPRAQAFANHSLAGNIALAVVMVGLIFATLMYVRKVLNPADAAAQFPAVYRFLQKKWYFDELYSFVLVRPGVVVAGWARWFDTNIIDGILHLLGKGTVLVSFLSGQGDRNIVDGLANLIAGICQGIGTRLRGVQTGYIRSYVLFLVLAVLGLWILLNAYYLGAATK